MTSSTDHGEWWRPLTHAGRVIVVIFSHAMIGAAILLSLYGIEMLMHLLWHGKEPVLFERIAVHTVIQASETSVFLSFIFWGAISIFKAMKG